MIFVTTGTQLPFPRLLSEIDRFAPELGEKVVAQVGPDRTPRPNLDVCATLAPSEFARLFDEARLIVAHAGVGTILSAKAARKPLIVVPRRFDQGEHRNDHQLATAKQVEHLTGIHICWEIEDLEVLMKRQDLAAASPEPGPNSVSLIARLREFIDA